MLKITTLIKNFRNGPFENEIFSYNMIGNEINVFGDGIGYFITKKFCFIADLVVKENFSFPKRIIPFQKRQPVALKIVKLKKNF